MVEVVEEDAALRKSAKNRFTSWSREETFWREATTADHEYVCVRRQAFERYHT